MKSFWNSLKTKIGIKNNSEAKEEISEKSDAKQKLPSLTAVEPVEEAKKWPQSKGQLAVDLYQTENQLIVEAPIAGIKFEDLEIFLERDVLTIQGRRIKTTNEKRDYFIQECYWGDFIREIILPVEVNPEKISAEFKNGILTIYLSKLQKEKKRIIALK